jgi:predicted O-methyltransferase YrrM
MSVLQNPELEQRLATLHAKSDEQLEAMKVYHALRDKERKLSPSEEAAKAKCFLSDKLVALDRDKAEFCYQLLRSINARRVVEIGTSYGISTLYLAAALRDNVQGTGDGALVIGTEYEPGKAAAARAEFEAAGLSGVIQLLEGDLRDTLKAVTGPIDFMLVDIWIPMARPALELVAPHLRSGAIVICDNTEAYRDAYADYFAFINDPANGFSTMTLPFTGGLELSVHNAPRAKALDRWRNQESK